MNDPTTPHRMTRTPLLTGSSVEAKRAELLKYFQDTFRIYERLFDLIADDTAFYSKAEPLRHPLIFYFGHTATFYVNKFVLAGDLKERINPHFEAMFAIGVDEMSWDDLNVDHYDWPAVAELRSYRKAVFRQVTELISKMEITLPIRQQDPAWTLLMGIEHERIHLETSSVIMRMLPLDQLKEDQFWSPCSITGQHPTNQLLLVPGRMVELAKSADDATYGWDNEFGSCKVEVSSFNASKYLVTNGEYLEFIQDLGYKTPEFWCEEGGRWVKDYGRGMPRFWSFQDGQYFQRNLTEIIPLPHNWPVEVNFYEAAAFCRWKSAKGLKVRLPTEAEWRVMREMIPTDQPDWNRAPGNINLEQWASSCPVDRNMTQGFGDIVGNVWQWTDSPIAGFPGFQVHPLYDDFSTPTFDGKHNLIKGGSWISTGNESLKSARYAFRKHFFQHAGFRYVSGESATTSTNAGAAFYESDEQVSQYLEFHYGQEYFGIPNYPATCVKEIMAHCEFKKRVRALDLGCAVGRSTFELAAFFDEVTGIDFSARFIQNAVKLKEGQAIGFPVTIEGDIVEDRTADPREFLTSQMRQHATFVQGDACNLKDRFREYDLVFAGNLIDRLYHPQQFLELIRERIEVGGYLVLTSPYTWLESHTKKENWLGGHRTSAGGRATWEAIGAALGAGFALGARLDVPFVIRETLRKYQHSVAEMTVWVRIS